MKPDPAITELLSYLGDLGYRDLYLSPDGGASGSEDPGQREEALTLVAKEAAACQGCGLAESRQTVVFASGDPKAQLMLIGEGPGANEDREGLPFVGAAGQLLNRILEAIGLERDNVYVANIVKCRPPGNRNPQPDEIAACSSFLERQIDLVQPKVLVALGRVAAHALLRSDQSLGRLRGSWYEVQGVPTRVTYHPAALLRNEDLKRPTWQDMQVVRDRLKAP
ncbi:MAG: uracil-DNA glycosylase [Deltaproteobacteria bacterium]|nr:uracil-DNA glycosylase [Deltaproteobacteria bacterium]